MAYIFYQFQNTIGLTEPITKTVCATCGAKEIETSTVIVSRKGTFLTISRKITMNKKKIKINRHKYYLANKELELNRAKDYNRKNSKKIAKYQKEYFKTYYKLNRQLLIDRVTKFRKDNPEHFKNYLKTKRILDVHFKLSGNLKSRINQAIQNNSKRGHTLELLGCSIEFLKKHIESQFKEGMNWDNWALNGWHIDHIYPCASFNFNKKSEQKICFHWSNLQPLWAKDNFEKSDKI